MRKVKGIFSQYSNMLGVIYEDGSMNPTVIPMINANKAQITNLGNCSQVIFDGNMATVCHDTLNVKWNVY